MGDWTMNGSDRGPVVVDLRTTPLAELTHADGENLRASLDQLLREVEEPGDAAARFNSAI